MFTSYTYILLYMYISIYYDLQTSFKMQIWNLIGYRKPYDFRQPMRCKFFGLKRSEKRQERVPDRLMQKLNKFTKVFRIFIVLQTCFKS